ncbi:MAG TPA: glutamate ABC transporter substrate-binding protein [Streptosporangiaceae bacterium]|jgi:glutamate transport system substrate-binding protein
MRIGRIVALVATASMALTTTAACGGGSSDSIVDKAKNDKKLTIGVKFDQPGLGQKQPTGKLAGFDIDVATYIAKKLGVPAGGIDWKETVSGNRETFLQQGQVDMVIATYSITPERQKKILYGGPYYVAHQDFLVKDGGPIKQPSDLNGHKLCAVQGSVSAKQAADKFAKKAQLQPEENYSNCAERLLGGQVDAVSTDDTILAGYAAQNPGKLKILGKAFTDERYGVGLRKTDKKGCLAVNKAITAMHTDGTWEKSLKANFGPAKFKYDDKLPAFVGCG